MSETLLPYQIIVANQPKDTKLIKAVCPEHGECYFEHDHGDVYVCATHNREKISTPVVWSRMDDGYDK